MLMNFSLGDSALNPKAIFKGGRWRDRLSAKKSTKYHARRIPNGNRPSTNGDTLSNVDARGEKGTGNISENPPKKRRLTEGHHRQALDSRGPQEVVSSLFSNNPTSNVPIPTGTDEGAEAAEPSNAPLIDGLDTFTSLGLSTTLATHLLTKLDLKAPTAIQKAAITQLIKEDSDAFIQAETGSGKTLAYLLPIVQRIMELSKKKDTSAAIDGQVHRDSGLFAVILAPTRELCKQISVVLDSLLRCAHWIVAGTVIGGEKKKSEKARLRKGLNVLVATPGRLADHLDNTEVLDVSNVRWLVLDEGDRLMELGFEEEIRGIVAKLEDRSRAAKIAPIPGLPTRRTTVLCSATMKINVQRLGEISLKDAVHIKADPRDANVGQEGTAQESFSAPSQLKQSYIVVPAKQRLVTLAALLKHTFARKGSVMKVIVFLSCADSVDFHFQTFALNVESRNSAPTSREIPAKDTAQARNTNSTTDTNPGTQNLPHNPTPPMPLLPTTSLAPSLTSSQNAYLTLYKLHGSLSQPHRTATLSAFTRSPHPSILLCTDVASRGLDLPNIDLVIEYDPPFSSDDHLHRVGRTARAGRDGRAVIFLMPGTEEGYVDVLKSVSKDVSGRRISRSEAADVLKRGFGKEGAAGKGWEERVTEWQLGVERWMVGDQRAGEMARKAFVSHVRAYTTHVAKEREMFDVKALHLGHLAKAFALRERPGNMGRVGGEKSDRKPSVDQMSRSDGKSHGKKRDVSSRGIENKDEEAGEATKTDSLAAARKMRAKMQEHLAGANEFNIG